MWHLMTSGLPALETLVREDSSLKLQPWLATSWEIAPDRKSITFKLRQGVKFHDGSDLNAEAVKFNLDAVMAAKQAPTKYWSSIDAVDNYTVRINLTKWENSILPGLASHPTGMIVSATAVKKNGKDWAKLNPVGTGPFKLVKFTPDVLLEYTKFTDYWQKDKPYLDGIKFISTANTQAALLAFQAGEGDVITTFDSKIMGDLKAMGAQMVYKPDGVLCLNPDSASPDSPFANKKVREALEYAIDREAIGKALGYGFYNAHNQWPLAGGNGYIPDLPVRNYDPVKAKQLLTEAGYPNGFKCRIGTNIYPQHSEAIQAYLKKAGIDASIWDLTAPGAYADVQAKGWPSSLFIAANGSVPNFLNSVATTLLTPNYYVSLKAPPDLKMMYDSAISTVDVDPQKVQMISRSIHDEALVGRVVYVGIARAISPKSKVYDLGYHSLSDIVFKWTPETAWMGK